MRICHMVRSMFDYVQISTSVLPTTEDAMQGPHALTTRVDSSVLVQPATKETALIVQVVTLAWYATLMTHFYNHIISRALCTQVMFLL